MRQGLRVEQVQTRAQGGDNWEKNLYQLRRRFKTMLNWAQRKHIGQTEFLTILNDILCEDKDGRT